MPLVQVILFSVAVLAFSGLETYLASRQKDDDDDSQDAGSLKTITRLRNVSFITAIVSAIFPVLSIPGSRGIHLLIGSALIMAGFTIRAWAIARLGQYFTSLVMTHADHTLVIDGPYKYIRHPGYTGGLLFYLGIGTATGSLWGLLLIMVLMSYGIDQRIKVEERLMISSFGEEYIDYMKKTEN